MQVVHLRVEALSHLHKQDASSQNLAPVGDIVDGEEVVLCRACAKKHETRQMEAKNSVSLLRRIRTILVTGVCEEKQSKLCWIVVNDKTL